MMKEGCSSMQPQLGNDHMVDGGQPEPATIPINSTTGLQPVNDHQMADEAANSVKEQDVVTAINIDGQDSGNDPSSRPAAVSSHKSRILADFEFLWRLRKYLLLLSVLAVSVTYNAGLSPPGGFWTDNRLNHHAGDPLLPVEFFQRYGIFFYCNATAFAASLVLIILLLSRGVSSQHVWLRSIQVTMILDLFSLMGAYAAGSCRALRSSVYILVLVFAVFLYVWIHILVSIRVVPNGLKEKVQNFLLQIIGKLQTILNPVLSICYVSDKQRTSQNGHGGEEQRSMQNEKEEIEEARKFILMLTTFAATITYQAGMSPPGGFWAVNKYGYRAATFVLRRHNRIRFNIFICCNDTSFVASLVTVILLLSTELSMHGIRTQALFVCVIADLLSLTGAYAAGCCRDVATSLSVVFIIVVVFICVLILVMFFQSTTVTAWINKALKPRFDKFLSMLSWRRGRQQSNARQEDSQSTYNHDLSTADVLSASTNDFNSMEDSMSNTQNQSHDQNEQVASSAGEEESAGSQEVAIPKEPSSSSDSVKSIQGILPLWGSGDKNTASGELRIAADDSIREESSEVQHMVANSHGDSAEQHAPPMVNHHDGAENDNSNDDQARQHREIRSDYGNRNPNDVRLKKSRNHDGAENNNSNDDQPRQHREICSDYGNRNPNDVRLKKSRTYLLLLAILAVSLTYQAGLNPPGGFWTSNASNHSAGDPILEDNYHKRYIAFFYFNVTAFLASLVMIIMLLNRKMSNKAIKRRALQTAMITDLLALLGAFVVGSCREKTKSIYISVVIFFVVAYVPLHVLVSTHVISGRWKGRVAKKPKHAHTESLQTNNNLRDAKEKDLERRRNFLFILAILAATVTYQAGLNPPGGIWPDENSKGGKPGNPVLQDSHPKRYDVFYYSNAVSFVSSVAIIILLVNRESCEHGIKSYALRVCLVAGLLGLLIAYTAGSCRKVKSIIYLIIIAVAVLLCLVIQVLVLSSTKDALKGPVAWLRRWLQKIFPLKPDSGISLQSSDQANSESNAAGSVPPNREKKEKKRHKYLMLLAILAASIAYQAGLNPPGGFWSDDSSDGHKAGNPILRDIHSRRYMVFFVFNSISFMASISVILLLLSKSVRKKNVPLQALHLIMILDLLALMTSYAAGSCRKVVTSIYVFVVVCAVMVYLLIVIILSSGIAKWLKERKGRWLPC